MKFDSKLRAFISVVVLVFPVLTLAHHSHSSLDPNDNATMIGVITEFRWQSPHVYLKANVAGPDGKNVEYIIETMNPPTLMDAGWTKETFKPGDTIIWYGSKDKDKNRAYMGLEWAETADGTRYYSDLASLRRSLAAEGKDVSGDLSSLQQVTPAKAVGEGNWSRIGPDGGRFAPIRTPKIASETWPLTEAARAQIAVFTEDNNPMNECVYTGPPRSTIAPMNFKFTRTDDAILMDRDLWPYPRVLHLNKDAPKGEPSTWGHSVAWFEGDELVVETTNFLAEKWGLFLGIDSSEQKHLIERFSLSEDGLRLNLEMTITDPVYLTEPVKFTHQWGKVADRDVARAECSEENANFYITGGYE